MQDDAKKAKEVEEVFNQMAESIEDFLDDYEYLEDTFDSAKRDRQLIERSNQTIEQQRRDSQITRLLEAYVSTYIARTQRNLSYKDTLFHVSILLFIALVVACLLAILATMTKSELAIADGIALISVCITAIGSIAFLLEIIAKHIFPEGEDKNITEIVQAIQKNDLDDKQVNIDAQEWRRVAAQAMCKKESAKEGNVQRSAES